MKTCCLILFALSFTACGGSTTTQAPAGGICTEADDCHCPVGAESSCADGTCYCLSVEVVEAPPAICHSASDCDCGNIIDNVYEPVCQADGMCLCRELNQECYELKRGEFTYRLMRDWIDLDNYMPQSGPHFPDVPPAHQYYVAIEAAYDLGLINGSTDGTFRPDDNVNRAEGSKFICQAINGEAGFIPPASQTYRDVAPTDWFYTYIEALTALELTKGYVDSEGNSLGIYGPANVATSCFINELLIEAELPTGF